MKTLLFTVFLGLSLPLIAQTEYPDIYSVSSEFERIEIIRLKNGIDMLEGLNHAVKEKNINNGVILAGIGSVTDYHYHVVSSRTLPPSNEFAQAAAPMDLVSVQGYIFNQRVHAHISLSDENSVVGGHLEPGTKALTFLIITIGVLPDDLKIERFDKY
jgi:predicted DNA-binding protein with PD1-like motif